MPATANPTDLAILALEDGTVFHGLSIGAAGSTSGEVVFNTAMSGYQEILTDPSYSGQLVTLTYPHIGNTGCNEQDNESNRVMASGLIIRDCPILASSWRQTESLPEFLTRQGVVAIADIDTRMLTRILREKGTMGGAIVAGQEVSEEKAIALARSYPGMQGVDLAREVTTAEPYEWTEGSWDLDSESWRATVQKFHVVAFDFGIKRNILRLLADRGCRVTVVPANTPPKDVLGMNPDGIFLSNGPGDPEPCSYAIEAIEVLLPNNIPIFGICLGHQLLALASGAQTVKMKFGHHGANHPVQDLVSGQVMITSQNHGFAVDEDSLPEGVTATHRSLFDGSLQGIELAGHPAFSFQGHPEASPGPHDIDQLFDRFIDLMSASSQAQNVTQLSEAR